MITMASSPKQEDQHFSTLSMDNLFRRLILRPARFNKFVSKGDQVADLGSGPGYFTLPLAEKIGPNGHIYAVDSDSKVIQALRKKAAESGLGNIRAYATSAVNVPFIMTASIDFVLAWELLCCVAHAGHRAAINEIKRILKPGGKAMLSVDRFFSSYVKKTEWKAILEEFNVKNQSRFPISKDSWALVSKKS